MLLRDYDADSLCQSVFELIRGPFALDVYFHYLVTEDGQGLELASCGGSEEARAILGTGLAFGQAVCGTVAQTCEWMYLTDIQKRNDDMTSIIRNFGVRCYTCQPLILDNEIVGTLSFGSCSRNSFKPEELEMFRLVARQVNVVTERRRASERLRELEELATVGRMCATLAHEINNPLAALSNLLYLVQGEVNSEHGAAIVTQAEDQVTRLAETTKRTLDLFRGRKIPAGVVNVSDLARELVGYVKLPRGVRVKATIFDDVCVKAVAGELWQVMFNLISNAGHFSPERSEVFLTLAKVDEEVEIRVRDLGPGISETTRPNLFKPFYSTRKNGGTGLGLWISKEMVERAGGTLTFASDPVRRPGTEFIVTLPVAAA
jgi:signal transduction histidine kinase